MIVYDSLGLFVQMGGRRMYPLYVWTWLPYLLVACALLSYLYTCCLLILVVSTLALNHDAFSVALAVYVYELILLHRIKVLLQATFTRNNTVVDVSRELGHTLPNNYRTMDRQLQAQFNAVVRNVGAGATVPPADIGSVSIDEFMYYLRHLSQIAATGRVSDRSKAVVKISMLLRSNYAIRLRGPALLLLVLLLLLLAGWSVLPSRKLRRPKGFTDALKVAETHKIIGIEKKEK